MVGSRSHRAAWSSTFTLLLLGFAAKTQAQVVVGAPATAPAASPLSESACGVRRAVIEGNTCDEFARSYDLSLQQLQQLNPTVDCNNLQIAATLCLGNALPNASTCSATHTVQPEETCGVIASHSDPPLTVDQLTALNPQLPNGCINIPVNWTLCTRPAGQAPAPASCGREHTVQQGDICYDIASSNGITLQELENLNPTVDCSALQLGATLCLGEGSSIAPATAPAPAPAPAPGPPVVCGKEYTIKQGDICYNLAGNNSLTLQQLQDLNPGVNCGNLMVGSTLCVGAGAPSPPATVTPQSGSSSHAGAIAGGVVGGVAGLAVIALAAILVWRLSRRRRAQAGSKRGDEEASWLSNGTSTGTGYTSQGTQQSYGVHSKDSDKVLRSPGKDYDSLPLHVALGSDSADDGSRPGMALLDRRRSSSPSAEPFDWLIDPGSIRVCLRPDGSLWQLGSGATGTVFKALLDDVNEVAIKRLNASALANADVQLVKFREEIELMAACRHKNLVQFLGASMEPQAMFMVTELMKNDLFTAIKAGHQAESSEWLWYSKGRAVALDVARGLTYLHSHNFIHFDIKSLNCLIGFDGTAKLADVGLAQAMQLGTHLSQTTMRGTFAYIAPELLTGQRCTAKVDIFSLGTVIWELVTGEQPQRGRNRTVRVPAECPAEIAHLIDQCSDLDPARRPTAKEVVQLIQNSPTSLPA